MSTEITEIKQCLSGSRIILIVRFIHVLLANIYTLLMLKKLVIFLVPSIVAAPLFTLCRLIAPY